ncbi:MAG TPA: hypothetical protein VIW24_30360 [Aldersonia sp.]
MAGEVCAGHHVTRSPITGPFALSCNSGDKSAVADAVVAEFRGDSRVVGIAG